MQDPAATALRTHATTLRAGELSLRPMTEEDWPPLLVWNNDPEVLYFAEGDHVTGRSLDEVQSLYRWVSRSAWMFIIEYAGAPIGECWLQRMNVPSITAAFPGQDLRRVDLMIGDKSCWGRGLGTRTIQRLTEFAFADEGAAHVFACDVADYNTRSLAAFRRAGYRPYRVRPAPPGAKAETLHDLVRSRQDTP